MENTVKGFADERGLPTEFLEEHVREAGDDEQFPRWLAFDYPHLTGIWGTRYRNPDPGAHKSDRYRATKGWTNHLYNPTLAGPNASEIWMAEGEIDTLTLVFLGLRAVGLPGVTEKGESFKREWKPLYETAVVVVAFDNDTTGQGAALKAKQAFHPRSHIFVPPEGMDINDMQQQDPQGLKDSVFAFRRERGLV